LPSLSFPFVLAIVSIIGTIGAVGRAKKSGTFLSVSVPSTGFVLSAGGVRGAGRAKKSGTFLAGATVSTGLDIEDSEASTMVLGLETCIVSATGDVLMVATGASGTGVGGDEETGFAVSTSGVLFDGEAAKENGNEVMGGSLAVAAVWSVGFA